MYPNTAINLKEKKQNALKDFLSITSIYGVSHMMLFTSTEKANYVRFAKTPQGPTITFKINGY